MIEFGDHAARLGRARREALIEHRLLDDDVSAGERCRDCIVVALAGGRRIDRGSPADAVERDVALKPFMQSDRVLGDGSVRIDHGRQFLVRDPDCVDRVAGDVAVGGNHHCHRLADVAHPIDGQRMLVGRADSGHPRYRADVFGQLRAGKNQLDPADRFGRAGVDGADVPVGDLGPLEGGVQHAG